MTLRRHYGFIFYQLLSRMSIHLAYFCELFSVDKRRIRADAPFSASICAGMLLISIFLRFLGGVKIDTVVFAGKLGAVCAVDDHGIAVAKERGASFPAAGSRLVESVVTDNSAPSETMIISPCVSVR